MEFIKRNAIGLGISSFILLVAKLFSLEHLVRPEEIWFTFFVALVSSNLSFLDHIEKLSYWQIVLFHFLGTYFSISLVYFCLNPFRLSDFLNFSFNTIIIYIVIWSVLILKNYIIAKKLDQKLKK